MTILDDPRSLGADAEWELWYQDNFDWDFPRQVELRGHGLVRGLVELWARHLFETVQADGSKGFSRFNLWWKQERASVTVAGEWSGQVRLRGWVYGDTPRPDTKGYTEAANPGLLERVATAHRNQILRGETSEAIVAAVSASEHCEDFEERLLHFSDAL